MPHPVWTSTNAQLILRLTSSHYIYHSFLPNRCVVKENVKMSWDPSNAYVTMGSQSKSAWRRAARTTMSVSLTSTTAIRLPSARTQTGHMTASVGRDSLVTGSAVRCA